MQRCGRDCGFHWRHSREGPKSIPFTVHPMKRAPNPTRTTATRLCLRAAGIAVLCVAASFWTVDARAFTAADADAAFEAHIKAFYEADDSGAWFKENTEGGKVSYWMRAEQ